MYQHSVLKLKRSASANSRSLASVHRRAGNNRRRRRRARSSVGRSRRDRIAPGQLRLREADDLLVDVRSLAALAAGRVQVEDLAILDYSRVGRAGVDGGL